MAETKEQVVETKPKPKKRVKRVKKVRRVKRTTNNIAVKLADLILKAGPKVTRRAVALATRRIRKQERIQNRIITLQNQLNKL